MTYDVAGGGAKSPAGVARQSDLAMVLFRRWVGAWIDFGALIVCLVLPPMLLPLFKDLAGNKQIADGAIWAGIALLVVYFPITEGLWGRSLGKLLTGMVVVNAAGNPPGVGRAIIRTMTRLAEVNPFFVGGLPAAVFVALSKERQRLGDLMSGTYVIQSGELKRIKTLRTAASGKHFPT